MGVRRRVDIDATATLCVEALQPIDHTDIVHAQQLRQPLGPFGMAGGQFVLPTSLMGDDQDHARTRSRRRAPAVLTGPG
jgi:hypothetical protein